MPTGKCDTPIRSNRWILLCWSLLLLTPLLWAGDADWTNPRSDWWREIREGVSGYSAVVGQETGELIQASGEFWRQLRNGPVSWFGGLALGGVLAALSVFYLVKGPIRLAKPRTGVMVPRWNTMERCLHWVTALLFITLALTGLSILYGRTLLLPLLDHEALSSVLHWSKLVHNFSGPVFVICLLAMTLIWFKDNLWRRVDWQWFKSLGSMFGDDHPPAGRMNAGEKAWFWLLVVFGLLVSVTGMALDFPVFGLGREWMQLSHLFHLVGAIVLMVGALGHIYIGSIGTEGALEGMVRGKVDLNWARQHHKLWLEEIGIEKPGPREKETSPIERPRSFFRPTT